jgi:hypothetical protein
MRRVVRSAALIAFSIACGYAKLLLFPYLFFVELFTLALFVSGVIVGPGFGLWVGIVARLVFSVANPLGPPHPWVLAAQVIAGGIVGVIGGLAGPWLLPPPDRPERGAGARAALLAVAAIVSTVTYDLLTNLAQGIAFGSIPVTLAAGLLPALQHLASNLALFLLIGNLLVPWLRRHPLGMLGTAVGVAVTLALLPAAAPAAPAPSDSTASSAAQGRGSSGGLLRWSPGTQQSAVDSASAAAAAGDSAAVAARDSAAAATEAAAAAAATAAANARRHALAGRIEIERDRDLGVASYEEALPSIRPVWTDRLPVYGPPLGTTALADGGGRYRVGAPPGAGDGSTDRTIFAFPGVWGIPDLAVSLDDPAMDGGDLLDNTAIDAPVEPGALQGPAEALSALQPRAPSDVLRRVGGLLPRRFRTTLDYRKGTGGEMVAGVRFLSPTIWRGVYASFVRREGEGVADVIGAVRASRYDVVAALPKVARRTLSAEARLLRREVTSPIPNVGEPRAEVERTELNVRAEGRFPRRIETWVARATRMKRTDVGPGGARTRWEIPEASLAGTVAWGDSASGWLVASAQAAEARIGYREDALPSAETNVASGRLAFGARRPVGRIGLGADVAVDLEETHGAEWDARASAWHAGPRAVLRLDVESAHERPSWIDLLSPARGDTLYGLVKWITYSRAGNPGLGPRRMTGSVGRLSVALARGVVAGLAGTVRHVTGDFGWEVTRVDTPDTVHVAARALDRGDGWLSHGSLRLDVDRGPWRAHAAGWMRGGPGGLSPRAGSPPRAAFVTEIAARATFFQGDLPAWLSVAAHGQGPRSGLVREPGIVTCDASLRFDLGDAGVFFAWRNLFDRTIAGGTVDGETGNPAPMPGRTFHFGATWDLLD